MKAILLKPEVSYWPHFVSGTIRRWIAWRWYCRICGREGRVVNYRWNYIAHLGLTHLNSSHPAEEVNNGTL